MSRHPKSPPRPDPIPEPAGASPWTRLAIVRLHYRWRVPLLGALAGVLLALSFPGYAVPGLWVAILVPLFWAAETVLARPELSVWPRAWRLMGTCWLMGAVWAAITGDWLVNTAYVYGGVSLPMADLINIGGHSLLVGSEFFAVALLPYWIARGRPRWALLLVPAWGSAVQAYWPHLFMWSFGQFMWQADALVQPADVLGSAGLNWIYLPAELVLFAGLRAALGRPLVPRRDLAIGTGIVLAGLVVAGGYGAWRANDVAQAAAGPPAVRVIAIQPNFSLKRLASNPALSPSDRQQSLGALIRDSERALDEAGPSDLPTVLVWPESVYPTPYFLNIPVKDLVEEWVRRHGIHLVLASVDVQRDPAAEGGRRVYGVAVNVTPDGSPPAVYRKIFLMPFGETIPFGDWFPWYRRLLLEWIPQIGEFAPGTEYTVFPIAPGVRVAPMICYDGTQVPIAQGMVANGANLGLVLANLAWFGPTSASLQFEHVIRFRAIENRVPVFFVSQNGRTVLFDATGADASKPLPAFQARTVSAEIALPNTWSFFTHYGRWMDRAYAVLAIGLAGALWWAGRKRG